MSSYARMRQERVQQNAPTRFIICRYPEGEAMEKRLNIVLRGRYPQEVPGCNYSLKRKDQAGQSVLDDHR